MCFAKYSTELQTKIVKMQRIRLLVLLLLCVVCQQTFAQQRTISGLVISAEDQSRLSVLRFPYRETKRMG